jgi:hypothetical protein
LKATSYDVLPFAVKRDALPPVDDRESACSPYSRLVRSLDWGRHAWPADAARSSSLVVARHSQQLRTHRFAPEGPIMTDTTTPSFTCEFTAEEREELVRVLEHLFRDKQIESHRAEAFAARKLLGHEVTVLAGILEKLRASP